MKAIYHYGVQVIRQLHDTGVFIRTLKEAGIEYKELRILDHYVLTYTKDGRTHTLCRNPHNGKRGDGGSVRYRFRPA